MVSPGLPCLNDMLLVEGKIANLISISQLCDQGLNVNFSISECIITNKDQEVIMKVSRYKDNSYMWISHPSSCMISKIDETKLWHQSLGHLNFKGIKKVISSESILGLPYLKIEEGKICGEYQIGN